MRGKIVIVKWNTHLTVFIVSTTKIEARGTILIIKWNRHFMSCLVCHTKTDTKTILQRTDTYFHQLECPSHACYSEQHKMGTCARNALRNPKTPGANNRWREIPWAQRAENTCLGYITRLNALVAWAGTDHLHLASGLGARLL